MAVGIYGYGKDFIFSYSLSNFNGNSWYKDNIGWRVATFTIFNIHFGIFITSFLISYSVGKLTFYFFQLIKFNEIIFFIILYLIILHTWPAIMSTSNAMRQGLAMSLIFLSLIALMSDQKLKSFMLFLIVNFLHISGIFFFGIYILTLLFSYFSIKKNHYLISVLILFLSTIFYILFELVLEPDGPSIIIGYDFSFGFLIINLFLISIFTFQIRDTFANSMKLYCYIFSFFAPIFYLHGFLFQLERINMVVLILNIFLFGSYFKKTQTVFVWFLCFSTLLSFTYLTGMYDSFYKINQLNLDLIAPEKSLSELTESEREVLRKMFSVRNSY